MRFIILADLHLTGNTPIARLDNIEDTWKRKLKFILDYAKKEGLSILTAGDVFDKPRDWRVLTQLLNLLEDYKTVKIASIWGQHDQYLYSPDRYSTSLGVLIKTGIISELNNLPWHSFINYGVYGCSWGQEIPIPNAPVNILVIHKSISDAPLFPGHEYTNAEMFLRSNPEYSAIICGDIHRRFVFTKNNRIIINPGPLLRLEATEYNMTYEPKFAVLDTDSMTIEWIDIPHEPAEKVLSRKHIERKQETENMLDDFIKNISVDHKITFSFKENLQEYLTKNEITQDIINIISKVMEE